jgi:predicted transcriptional regulator
MNEVEKDRVTCEKLDTIIDLLRKLLAMELAKRGVSRGDIAKRLHVAKATAVKMLAGIRTE